MFFKKLISVIVIITFLTTTSLQGISFADDSGSSEASSSQNSSSQDAESNKAAPQDGSSEGAPDEAPNAPREGIGIDYTQFQKSSGFNIGALENFQTDLFTGRATFSVPIQALPGRRGIQPNVNFSYASGNPNGHLGVGWSLELGSIQRSTKKGVPAYDDSGDTFIFNSSGSQTELVNIGGSQYRAKQESAFMKFYFDGSYWEVTDKSGIKYYLGQNSNSRQEGSLGTFKWCLNRIEDLFGNDMDIIYFNDSGQVYPEYIVYSGGKVAFDWSTGRSDVITDYRSGFLVKTHQRLSEVNVQYKNENDEYATIRKYKLNYRDNTAAERVRSVLYSIIQENPDSKSRQTLPPITFGYTPNSDEHNVWEEIPQEYPDDISFNLGTRILDVNNDSLPDILRYVNGGGSTYLNNGTDWEESTSWNVPDEFTFYYWPPSGPHDNGVRFADVNGDGWVDLVKSHMKRSTCGNDNILTQLVYLNNTTDGWAYNQAWTEALPDEAYIGMMCSHCDWNWGSFGGTTITDVNGDGLADVVISRDNNSDPSCRRNLNHSVYLNTGSDWQLSSMVTPEDTSLRESSDYTPLIDITGDGLPDFIIAKDGNRKTYINTGTGWVDEGAFALPDGDTTDGSTVLLDANDDGLVDVLVTDQPSSICYLNKGDGSWRQRNNYGAPQGDFSQGNVRALDMDGDGLVDFIYKNGILKFLYHNQLNSPDLLSSIDNGIGGMLSIQYEPSTSPDFDNTDGSLPFPVQVVKSITNTDTIRDTSISTSYHYEDGKFNFDKREFRGFGYVKVTEPKGSYSENYFHQDDLYKGRPDKVLTKDSLGNLYSKTTTTWSNKELHNNKVDFFYSSRTDSYAYNGNTTNEASYFKHTSSTSSQIFQDNLVIQSTATQNGDDEEVGDEKTQITEYISNADDDDWLISLPKYSYLQDENGEIISQKWFYYDDHETIDEIPAEGKLTKEEVWLKNPLTGIEDQISSAYSYDSDGNLKTSTNARGHSTTTNYDTDLNMFPVQILNALEQDVETEYYGINEINTTIGSGLFGQTKYTTDPNDVRTLNIYDEFGRIKKVIGPNDTVDAPAAFYEYFLNEQPVKIKKWTKWNPEAITINEDDYIISYTFFDGKGQLLQSKSPAEDDPETGQARQVVSGVVVFDERGKVKEKYLSYFSAYSEDYNTTFDTIGAPHFSFEYDAVGRLIQTNNPDGTYSETYFEDNKVASINENNHLKISYFDIYGRVTIIEEYETNDEAIRLNREANDSPFDDPYGNYEVYATTQYEYDAQGNLIKVIDAHLNETKIAYDSLGRKIAMDDPDMGTDGTTNDDEYAWRYQYDAVGNLTEQTDNKAQVVAFEYDELNRLTNKTGTIGKTSRSVSVNYIYDEYPLKSRTSINTEGRLVYVSDSTGSTEFVYDELGREIESTKEVSGVTFQVLRTYDALDRLTSVTYPNNDTTDLTVYYEYNKATSLEKVYSINPDTQEIIYYVSNVDYSATGQITKIVYGNGDERTYDYHPLTLRLDTLQTTNSQQQTIQNLEYEFDDVGNVTHIEDNEHPTNTQDFTYDDLSRLTQATGNHYGAINYVYDEIGNMTQKGDITYSYPTNGIRPHAVTAGTKGSEPHSAFDYDDNGNMTESYIPGIGKRDYAYDLENRLTDVVASDNSLRTVNYELKEGWNFISFCYLPDDKTISNVLNTLQAGVEYLQISRYNSLTDKFEHFIDDSDFNDFDELDYNTGYQIFVVNDVSVDIQGKRAPEDVTYNLTPWQNLISYADDEEKSISDVLLGVAFDDVCWYNPEVDTIERYSTGDFTTFEPTKSYFIEISSACSFTINAKATTTNFSYDGDGGRVAKEIRGSDDQVIRKNTYIGSLYEQTTNNQQQTTDYKKHIFMGGTRIASVNISSLEPETSNTYYIHGDHLGSSNVITNENGEVIQLTEYSPYGSTSRSEGEDENNYKFTGKELDSSTSLYYYGARYYDPTIGRFITPDTVVQAPTDPQTLNRYSYCRNNPINYVDPTGHSWFSKFWKTIVGAFVGAIVGVLTYGAGFSLMAAGFWGGLSGGALSGGLEGGWKGMLIGGAMGGVLGAFGGWGVGEFGKGFGYGMLVAGAGVSYGTGGTEGLERFGAGVFGALAGGAVGNAIDSYHHDGISHKGATEGQMANKGPSENKDWRMLGIGTTDAKAQADANLNQSVSFYTRSRGVVSDFIRAGIQKVFGNSLASRQFSGYLRGASGGNIYAHSEGTLTLAGAIKQLNVDGAKVKSLNIDFRGPVIGRSTASNLAGSIGATHTYQLNPADPIGVFTTVNPVSQTIYGVLGTATGAHFHSTPTYPQD